MEYSHSDLSVQVQQLLLCLAPFKGFIFREALSGYVERLQAHVPFSEWDFEGLEEAIDEAIQGGLLSPYYENDWRILRIKPAFSYFLQAKLAGEPEGVRKELTDGFRAYYQWLAEQYRQFLESAQPDEREWGLFCCQLEYENLFSALQTCLVQQESLSIYQCLDTYLDESNNLAVVSYSLPNWSKKAGTATQ